MCSTALNALHLDKRSLPGNVIVGPSCYLLLHLLFCEFPQGRETCTVQQYAAKPAEKKTTVARICVFTETYTNAACMCKNEEYDTVS